MIDNLQHIEHLLTEKIAGRHILVIGDLMLDRYLWGEVDRISPEAPIPVVKLTATTETPGGAANVALNLAGLGINVSLAGFVGKDEAGARLVGLLAERGIDTTPVFRVDCMPTVVKSRVIVQRNQMLRLDEENPGALSGAVHEELAAAVLKVIDKQTDAVVISDYAKGTVTQPLVRQVVAACRRSKIPVIVDPKGTDYGKYRGASCITPNFKEFCAAAGTVIEEENELLRKARELRKSIGVDNLVITRGDKGITAVGSDEMTVPAATREVFDVSGAGDTVVAVMAVAYMARLTTEEALKLANLAAGVVIGRVGTVAINSADLVSALYKASSIDSGEKLCDSGELIEMADLWHQGGLEIGLATGWLEVLSVDHIELLERTRAQCSRLIVLLACDRKDPAGSGRARTEAGRLIAALNCVDAVALVGEDAVEDVIDRIRPQVLVREGMSGQV